MALDISSRPTSLMATLSSTQVALLSLHSKELNSLLCSFDLTPWDAQVADVMAAQGVSTLRLINFDKIVLYFCVLKLQNCTFCTWI